MMIARAAKEVLRRALDTFRVVLIAGCRQVGKTTLARALGAGRAFLSLDDLGVLDAARSDPEGFVRGLPLPVTLDEVQRAPALLLPIKRLVDEHPEPGRFLLTGSADPTATKEVRETMAGRLGVVPLRPLTWAELESRPHWNPIDLLERCPTLQRAARQFAPGSPPSPTPVDRLVAAGGFPEPATRLKPDQRPDWHEQFARTYIERDIPLLLRTGDSTALLRFVRLAAGMTGGMLNLSHLARDAEVSVDTARRWMSVLQTTYLAELLPPWWRNVRKRLIKSPKLHFADSGLALHLLGIRDWAQAEKLNLAGPLVETWIHAQLRVFASTSKARASLHYFRSVSGHECDFVIETDRLIPVEVKAGQTPSAADADGLRAFIDLFPREAPFGLLLHAGTGLHPLGERILAVPMSAFLAGQGVG